MLLAGAAATGPPEVATLAPCNASVAPAKWERRRKACLRPELAQVREARSLPIFWSRAQARSQATFNNERPFPASKFEPFARLLPATANLSALSRWPAGCESCATCAVVGASGSILNHRQGRFIDAHDVVIRPNWLRTAGYEPFVGRRTSINLFFALEAMVTQFEEHQAKLPAAERAIGLATCSSERAISSYFRHLVRMRERARAAIAAANATGAAAAARGRQVSRRTREQSSVYLLSDAIFLRALAHLCAATQGGCEWTRRSGTMRPSTGFVATVLARLLCRRVSLFGLTTDPCRPFHYYGAPKQGCTAAIPKENDEHVHWFEREHALYHEWHARGLVTIHS